MRAPASRLGSSAIAPVRCATLFSRSRAGTRTVVALWADCNRPAGPLFSNTIGTNGSMAPSNDCSQRRRRTAALGQRSVAAERESGRSRRVPRNVPGLMDLDKPVLLEADRRELSTPHRTLVKGTLRGFASPRRAIPCSVTTIAAYLRSFGVTYRSEIHSRPLGAKCREKSQSLTCASSSRPLVT